MMIQHGLTGLLLLTWACIASGSHVLVTGGAGYIGSHTVLLLLQSGHEVTVIDNLVNSKVESLNRVSKLAAALGKLHFSQVDLRDKESLSEFFDATPSHFDACIHFAGLKAVGESAEKPLEYYDANVAGTVNLLLALEKANVSKFIFSSSATVYGDAPLPITEESPVGQGITNPYGRTKYVIEEILRDFAASPSGSKWAIAILRYFNPIGAHPSGKIGEDPNGLPNNLMPYVSQVAVKKLPILSVFGDDYETKDGTGVRDYLHVLDLAEGHLKALEKLETGFQGIDAFNLGSGHGYSVLEMIQAMERACQCKVPYSVQARRPGDLSQVYASTSKAKSVLGWETVKTLDDMCRDLWTWQSQNPTGYPDADIDFPSTHPGAKSEL